jgi:hypothetical protein
VKRILRYLKGTKDYRLRLGGTTEVSLTGYCDADWAGDVDERKSTTGYVFLIGNGVVSWKSKRQPTPALSTAEAEYQAATSATQEALWMRQLLSELGFLLPTATPLYSDNQGAIALARNPTSHSRTKHIDIKHHFIRHSIEAGDIDMRYCPTQEMVADVLTKGLPRDKHCHHMDGLGLELCGASNSGSVVVQ